MSRINHLTAEQDALIPIYQQKWQNIATSTQPIEKDKAIAAITKAYKIMGKGKPAIQFFASPNQIINELLTQPPEILARQLGSPIFQQPLFYELDNSLLQQIEPDLWLQLYTELQPRWQPLMFFFQQLTTGENISETELQRWGEIWQEFSEQQWENRWSESEEWMRNGVKQIPGGDLLLGFSDTIWDNLGKPVWENIGEPVTNEISKQSWMQELEENIKQFTIPWLQVSNGLGLFSNIFSGFEWNFISVIDYCIEVLGCQYNREKWLTMSSLIKHAPWVIYFERTCWVCERPNIISFDEQYRFHAVGKPAIAFNDGYEIYAYNGVILPNRYARVHPDLWQSSWLLTEQNAELRRVLIQAIGYARICQDLQATEIDSWREYTLLVIDNPIDIEPIHLLKMTCPSTNHIHATRVPPHIRSAKKAITWVNWDIDPEEFAVET